jgi:hypothetical protein
MTADAAYAFPDDLPLGEVPPGTNLLVSGPALEGGRALAVRLALPVTESEGAVLVTTDSNCEQLMRLYDGEWSRSHTAFVDCVATDAEAADLDVAVESVSSPGDLTGIGMAYSTLVERLARGGVTRARIAVVSLNSLLVYADLNTVYRFGHTVAGRVQATDGLGVFFVDPSTREAESVNTLSQFLDGRVDVRREADGRQLRCRGAVDGPSDWTAF